jgi:hypothetical protein
MITIVSTDPIRTLYGWMCAIRQIGCSQLAAATLATVRSAVRTLCARWAWMARSKCLSRKNMAH